MIAPLLSICIATYNRADYIGETLDSIIPQLTEEVELLVVDGASTDNTETIIHSYIKKSNRVRYVRLPVKGGVDQDYDKTIEFARGEWCWLFTDDDLLKPGGIETVLKSIQQDRSLIVINAEVWNTNFSLIIEKRRLVFLNDRTYLPGEFEKFFVDMDYYLSFIGAVIIRRSIWLNRNRTSYFGSEFVHVGVIFQEQLAGSVFVIAKPFIRIRYGNAQWSSRHFDIWMFKWPKLIWSFKNISDKAKSKVTFQEPWRKLRVLVYQRSIGQYNAAIYFKYLSEMQAGILWRFFAYAICFVPKWVCVFLCEIYFILKRIYVHYSKK
jgi:abequosyltransferase